MEEQQPGGGRTWGCTRAARQAACPPPARARSTRITAAARARHGHLGTAPGAEEHHRAAACAKICGAEGRRGHGASSPVLVHSHASRACCPSCTLLLTPGLRVRFCARQYCWLHRGTYSCALELCTGAPTDKCASQPMSRSQRESRFPSTKSPSASSRARARPGTECLALSTIARLCMDVAADSGVPVWPCIRRPPVRPLPACVSVLWRPVSPHPRCAGTSSLSLTASRCYSFTR